MEQNILSVSMLNEYVKMLIGGDRVLSSVYIRGEISNWKVYSSGHCYFTLKDEESELKAVMFSSYAKRMSFAPQNGMKVIARGRVSVYTVRGEYQLYAEELVPDGAGALALRFEQLKRKLSDEGLFDEERKKPLPEFPRRIGIITSPTGAAIHDLINVLGRRWPLANVILYPSQVQGSEAAPQLVSGVAFFADYCPVDVIILGRGGGSMEDLWAFNDETLARTVAACPIPVISAVGHESDFTICDFVADKRAPTPSAAAELAVPDQKELLGQLRGASDRMDALMRMRIEERRAYLSRMERSRVLTDPEAILMPLRMRVADAERRLCRESAHRMDRTKQTLSALAARLEAVSPLAVLARGYAQVSRDGADISRAHEIKSGDLLTLRFSDGTVCARAERREETEEEHG